MNSLARQTYVTRPRSSCEWKDMTGGPWDGGTWHSLCGSVRQNWDAAAAEVPSSVHITETIPSLAHTLENVGKAGSVGVEMTVGVPGLPTKQIAKSWRPLGRPSKSGRYINWIWGKHICVYFQCQKLYFPWNISWFLHLDIHICFVYTTFKLLFFMTIIHFPLLSPF